MFKWDDASIYKPDGIPNIGLDMLLDSSRYFFQEIFLETPRTVLTKQIDNNTPNTQHERHTNTIFMGTLFCCNMCWRTFRRMF